MTQFDNPSQPLVSIITPTFNQGQFIDATIQSVLNQTYQNIEYIVIDGMSTDQTAEIVEKYGDRISISIREPDQGQSDAIVKGFKLARGDLVGWINSDDLLYPDCVERLVDAYRNNLDAVLFYDSEIDIISEKGELINRMSVPMVSREDLLRTDNILVQPGSFYRRDALEKVDYFDTRLRYSMDLDLWLRLLKVGSSVDLNRPAVAAYREWGGTKTATGGLKLAKERKALLVKHGAHFPDRTLIRLQLAVVKGSIREILRFNIFRQLAKLFCLATYYGVLIHLPASNSKYTRWTRCLRSTFCRPLFRTAGLNINIEKGARFGTGSKISIGDNSGIGVDCQIMGTVSIGQNVMIGPEVMFITTSHEFDSIEIPMIEQGYSQERPIQIGDDVWIGARCTFLPGVTIGRGSIVGASSVVTKSIPEYSIAAGNPARVIRCRTDQS